MAKDLIRGSIWMYKFKQPDKLRPVLILSRQEVIGLIDTVIVAPITTTVYGVPSEVSVGIDEGLKHDSAVNLDHIQNRFCIQTHPLSRFTKCSNDGGSMPCLNDSHRL